MFHHVGGIPNRGWSYLESILNLEIILDIDDAKG